MQSRYLFVALPLLIATTQPTVAQDVVFVPGTGVLTEAVGDVGSDNIQQPDFAADDDISAMANRMGDPVVQDGVSLAVERATDAMMRLPIGRFADAIERARPGTVDRHIRGDATVADIAGRDSRYLPQELGERSREAMGMMSGFARAIATMMPEFERMGRDMEDSIREATATVRTSRY